MNKSFKLIGIITLMVIIGFSFVTCDTDNGDTHTHQWGAWQSNATQHWKECSCGEEYGRANHNGNPCGTCQYNDPSHSHSYSDTWSKDETQHWKECSCGDRSQQAAHNGSPCVCGYTSGSNPNPTTWTAVTNSGFGNGTGENESIYSITWGNGKFIAGSGGYPMAYSSNGTAWTPVTGTTDDEWDLLYSIGKKNSIVWGKDKYVIVTRNAGISTIFYSSNGTTAAWTKVADTAFDYSTSSSANGIMDVTWGGAAGQEKFVAVGDEGKMAYSSNGINWTPVTDSKFDTRIIRKVVWGNDKFVAVGGAGKMSYSFDGINWTPVADSKMNANYPIYSIAYGNGKFIAAGGNSSNAFMAFSTDGINWTPVANVPFTSGIINGIAYGNNKFVAVGQNGKAAYSSDCITWTQVTNTTFDTTHIQCIAWGNDKFIAGGPGGKMAYWDGN